MVDSPEMTKPPAEPPQPTPEQVVEKRFPFPEVKALEEIVGNWDAVPQSLLDTVKAVKVNTEAEYKLFANGMEIGSNKVAAGHVARPLKFRPGQLLVTNSRDGNTKAVVNIGDTDFKEQVRIQYQEHVDKGRQVVLDARKVALEILAREKAAGNPTAPEFGSAESDPRFKPALDYLASGQMIDHKLDEAKRWFWLGKETRDHKEYDAILVQFEIETVFGILPHPMKCLIEQGRVVKWINLDSSSS